MEKDQMFVCLTGQRGLLGTAFIDYCKDSNIRYTTLMPFPCAMEKIKEVLQNGNVTHFINAAGYSSDAESINEPMEVYNTNVHCVLNQLETIRRISPKTSYINFGSVYERSRETPYASSKRMSRELIDSYRNNYDLHCYQATLSYTEYCKSDANRFLPKLIRDLIRYKSQNILRWVIPPVKLYNKDDYFNYTWASDVCAATFDYLDGKIDNNLFIKCPPLKLWQIVDLILKELDLPQEAIVYEENEALPVNGRYDREYNNFDYKVSTSQIIKNLVAFELARKE